MLTVLVAGALGAGPAAGVEAASPSDRSFVAAQLLDGLYEIRAGQLAVEQGSRADIRDQGAAEVHDHTLAREALRAIAGRLGVVATDVLPPDLQGPLDALRGLRGGAFDAGWLRAMETIHVRDAGALASEARSGVNPGLRAFAAETVRVVQRHVGALDAVEAD